MERLALDRFSSPWLRNQHLERYHWASRFTRGLRVLDAACGSGYGSRILLDAGAREVTSVDLSPDAAAPSRFVRGDVAKLPLRNASVDAYVCFETIEHVPNDQALLREARRVLVPGGTFFCSTPNRNILSPGLTVHDPPRNPHHVREYSIPELESLLSGFFDDVELFAQTWFSDRHRELLAGAGRISNRLAVRLHQLRNLASLPWESRERHRPTAFDRDGAPEVVIGRCLARG
jgi:SAM-dependent methyltransferase